MIQFLLIIGGVIGICLVSVTVSLMSIALGPSANTITMCKEIEREGYLADECFDEYGLKDRHCRRVKEPANE